MLEFKQCSQKDLSELILTSDIASYENILELNISEQKTYQSFKSIRALSEFDTQYMILEKMI